MSDMIYELSLLFTIAMLILGGISYRNNYKSKNEEKRSKYKMKHNTRLIVASSLILLLLTYIAWDGYKIMPRDAVIATGCCAILAGILGYFANYLDS